MIADLKPYPVMKDSGVPWLGKVPEHWQTERAKWLFRKMDRPVQEQDEVVTCFRDGVVTLRKNRRVRGFTESLKEIGYQGVRRGDLVIHAMDAFAGAIGVSDADGKGTPVYSVCQPGPNANAHFFAFLVREMARSQWIVALAKGIRERSTDFRFDCFESQNVPLPPLPEQAAIVRFLDYMDRRIRKYIRAKQKLVKLLEEQKQSIIHRAVTRGLDPNVRLKPSGVEWLGDVPEHWDVRKVGAVSTRVTKGTTPTTLGRGFTDAGIQFVKVESISKDRTLIAALCAHIDADTDTLLARSRLRVGDVLVAIAGAIGRVAIVFEEDLPANCNQAVAIVTPNTASIMSDWLAFVLASPACQRALTDSSVQSAQANLSLADLRGTMISLPPIREQGRIVEKLVETTAAIAHVAASAQREIALLREYRTRLIADVVTGKLDVRDEAAQLSDEIDASELLDDVEETADNVTDDSVEEVADAE